MKSIKQQCFTLYETVQQILKKIWNSDSTQLKGPSQCLKSSETNKQQCFTIYETVQLILKHEIDANTTRDQANVWNPLNNSALPFLKQFNRF